MLPESESDRPPRPTPIDVEIARNKGTSVAIEATNESLQASKSDPTPSLSDMIEQTTRENGRLREQLAHVQAKLGPGTFLLDKVTLLMKELEQVVIEYYRLDTIIEQDRVNI
jgi:hypothetical protein